MSDLRREAFLHTISQAILAHIKVEVITKFSFGEGKDHHRAMEVLSIAAKGEGYEVMLKGFGIAYVEKGSMFTIAAP